MKLIIIKIILIPIVILRKLYWWAIKPTTIGVRGIVLNSSNQILLVKHTYANEWNLPGGKVKKGENLTIAIIRELSQEIGLEKVNNLKLFSTYSNFYEYKSDYISVFVITDYSLKDSIHFEIEKISFFDLLNLPPKTSRGTKRRIEEYLKKRDVDYLW